MHTFIADNKKSYQIFVFWVTFMKEKQNKRKIMKWVSNGDTNL